MSVNPVTVSVEEARRIVGCGRSTAYELVKTGQWPVLRFGRRIRIPLTDLLEWVEENTTKGGYTDNVKEG